MIAYISPKEKVLAVFRNHRNQYRIYVRNSYNADFVLYKAPNFCSGKFSERAVAENLLNEYMKTDEIFSEWMYFDYWRGEDYHDGRTTIGNIIGVQ